MARGPKETVAPPLPRRVTAVYALLMLAFGVELAVLSTGLVLSNISADYFAATKAARDAAAAGSPLLRQLGQLSAVGAWLEPLKFVGFALFFTAIGVALSAIIPMIRLRGATMAELVSRKGRA